MPAQTNEQEKAAIEIDIARKKQDLDALQERLGALDGVPEVNAPMPISVNGIRYCPVCWDRDGQQLALESRGESHGLGQLACNRCGYAVEVVD